MRVRGVFCGFLLAGLPASLCAQPWDGAIAPWQVFLGDNQLDLAGLASGAAFGASGSHLSGASGAGGDQNISGAAKLMPWLHRDFDSGLVMGLDATLTASDILSRGRYGGDVFEKAFGEVRTGLGRIEIGQTDGAAYDLSVTGPKVDDQVSLDNPQTTFFRDPSTSHAFTDILPLRTEVGASSNYAKFAYISPELFGAELAISFTPNQGKDVVPFLREGPQVAGRQADIWEGALKYSDDFGPLTLSAYGGGAWGRAEHKLPGQEGVSDLGVGARADYTVNDDLSLSLGGAWRQSNAYAFQIGRSFEAANSRMMQASASATYDSWVLGAEYGDGNAGSVASAPHLDLNGYEGSLGYVFSGSIQLTGGWQRLVYQRGSGDFYNNSPRIGLDAVFLHLNLKTTG